jgi:hypothetical protein
MQAVERNGALPSRRTSLDFSDDGNDDDAEELLDVHAGDYSARMGELFDDDDDGDGDASGTRNGHDPHGFAESDDDEGDVFVYDGKDAEPQASKQSYRDRLRDVLNDEDAEEGEEEEEEERQVEHLLVRNGTDAHSSPSILADVDEFPVRSVLFTSSRVPNNEALDACTGCAHSIQPHLSFCPTTRPTAPRPPRPPPRPDVSPLSQQAQRESWHVRSYTRPFRASAPSRPRPPSPASPPPHPSVHSITTTAS